MDDGDGQLIPKRGRPRKARPPIPEAAVPTLPTVTALRTVLWKSITGDWPWHANQESPKTLYIADDGSFVRFAYDERNSRTGKAIVSLVRAEGGHWDTSTGWTIPSPAVLERVKARALQARPAWRITSAAELAETSDGSFLAIDVTAVGPRASLLSLDLAELAAAARRNPAAARDFVWSLPKSTGVWVHDPEAPGRISSLALTETQIQPVIEAFVGKRLTIRDRPASAADWLAWSSAAVEYRRDWLTVRVNLNLASRLHWMLLAEAARTQKPGRDLGPEVDVAAEAWADMAEGFVACGGTLIDRTPPVAPRFSLDTVAWADIPGWDQPAKNSYRFYQHQREGLQFLVRRQMRALVGDEMGLGKTGTAIGAAIATGAKRLLVVAPANARWVWDREIRGWADDPPIRHIEGALIDEELPEVGWVIVTFDSLTPRRETFSAPDEATAAWLRAALDVNEAEESTHRLAFAFDPRHDAAAANVLLNIGEPTDPAVDRAVVDRLRRLGRRLSGDLLHRLLRWRPDIVFVDEAHRIKNEESGRTRAIRALIDDQSRGAVLLTGTPLRNHAGEGTSLIEAILPGVKKRLARVLAAGHWRDARRAAEQKAVADILREVMIRRTKAEVLDLPAKIRQRIDITLSPDTLEDYAELIEQIHERIETELGDGANMGGLRQAVMGLLSRARGARCGQGGERRYHRFDRQHHR